MDTALEPPPCDDAHDGLHAETAVTTARTSAPAECPHNGKAAEHRHGKVREKWGEYLRARLKEDKKTLGDERWLHLFEKWDGYAGAGGAGLLNEWECAYDAYRDWCWRYSTGDELTVHQLCKNVATEKQVGAVDGFFVENLLDAKLEEYKESLQEAESDAILHLLFSEKSLSEEEEALLVLVGELRCPYSEIPDGSEKTQKMCLSLLESRARQLMNLLGPEGACPEETPEDDPPTKMQKVGVPVLTSMIGRDQGLGLGA